MAYTASHSDEVADEVGLVVIADWGKFGNVSVHLLFTPSKQALKADFAFFVKECAIN